MFFIRKIFQTDQFFLFIFFQNTFFLNFQMLNFSVDNLMLLFSSKTVISVMYVCACARAHTNTHTHTHRFDRNAMTCKMVKQ